MKKNIKVSIIVPVYNVEKFIDNCIQSLINQTYQNIEIILLNDGSKDNSLEKIKEWEKKYPKKIKCESHKNIGVGMTRNKGIDLATGEYLTFVDSDDYLDNDFIETLVNNIDDCDIIVSGYKRVTEDGKIQFERLVGKTPWAPYRQLVIWAKLYKTSLIKRNNIKFNHLKTAEDVIFTLTTYSHTKKIKTIKYAGYNNVENFSSVTHDDKVRLENNVVEILTLVSKPIDNDIEYKERNKKLLNYLYLKFFTVYLLDKAKVLDKKELKKYNQEVTEYLEKKYKENNWKISFCYQKDEPFFVNLSINIVVLCKKTKLTNGLLWMLNKVYYKGKKK